jgi:hypothetical protein
MSSSPTPSLDGAGAGAYLEEPLLGDNADGSAPVDVAHEKQIIVHTPFQLEDFVRFVVLRWQAFLSECAGPS